MLGEQAALEMPLLKERPPWEWVAGDQHAGQNSGVGSCPIPASVSVRQGQGVGPGGQALGSGGGCPGGLSRA